MKYILNSFYSLICVVFLVPLVSIGQTGMHTQDISKNVILQIESAQNNGGVILPRLSTSQRDQIPLTSLHNGLMIFNIDESCINYYVAGISKWQSVCGQADNAQYTIENCNDIGINGVYVQEESLFKDHFITLEVQVQKPGYYSIVASSTQGNGYYFQASGKFLNRGKYTIKIPGYGTPTLVQNDNFQLFLNGENANCDFSIQVMDKLILPLYSMVCNSVKTYGAYTLHKALNNSNYIKVTLDVEPEAIGAMYEIQTNTIDGISFKGSGYLNSYTQEVTLYGSGIPYSVEDKVFMLTSNSQKTSLTCDSDLKMSIPGKRLLTIGSSENGYGYNFSGTAASNKLITEKRNYGTLDNSIVYFEGWKEIKGFSAGQANVKNLTEALLEENPYDIVILGYDYSMNVGEAAVLAEYIKKGGVLLSYTESRDGMQRFIRALTGDNTLKPINGGSSGTIYRFTSTNDEILNGPFGDLRGTYWGEDASTTVVIPYLSQSDFEIYSGSYNFSREEESGSNRVAGATSFRHKHYNFIWVGDGGFNSNHSGTAQDICPFKLDSNNYPITKPNYGTGRNKFEVGNAIFTANAIAWAIYQSEVNGINSSLD
ncbi:hypothetical protein ACYSNM_10010 [Myroides sp. LJL116]